MPVLTRPSASAAAQSARPAMPNAAPNTLHEVVADSLPINKTCLLYGQTLAESGAPEAFETSNEAVWPPQASAQAVSDPDLDTPQQPAIPEINEQKPLKILVVDDHEVTRYGLVLMLNERPGLHVVGQAETGVQAIALTAAEAPDVVLMDIMMPEMTGIEAARKIKALMPEVKIILLTSSQDPFNVCHAISAGVNGFCLKDIKIDRLCQVMAMTQDGSLWIDPAVSPTLANAMGHYALNAQGITEATPQANATHTNNPEAVPQVSVSLTPDTATHLTRRETEVLALVVAGKSNKEIAHHMQVTTHTAKAHVCKVIQKLGVTDRTQAAVKALQEGLLEGFQP
ncbi:MAG: response regulator transcription factor [Vampirovibrionales bacterium]|nr:response regulator transcription factor [Vampirovibrionales bacterium]